jgi:hypothetical protein
MAAAGPDRAPRPADPAGPRGGTAAAAYWREMRLDWLAQVLEGPCSSS